MIDRQMELTLSKAMRYSSCARRIRRSQRARWWFARMRQAVENAADWPAATPSESQRQE